MLILLGNLCKPYLTWKTNINKREDKKSHHTKNHIQELHYKKVQILSQW